MEWKNAPIFIQVNRSSCDTIREYTVALLVAMQHFKRIASIFMPTLTVRAFTWSDDERINPSSYVTTDLMDRNLHSYSHKNLPNLALIERSFYPHSCFEINFERVLRSRYPMKLLKQMRFV